MFLTNKYRNLLLLLFVFIILVPVGLISNYPAWGEWDFSYFKQKLGFIPDGIKNFKQIEGILPDYSLGDINSIFSYYLSAILGVILIFAIFYLLKVLIKHER